MLLILVRGKTISETTKDDMLIEVKTDESK
jgi:hypothetical protein